MPANLNMAREAFCTTCGQSLLLLACAQRLGTQGKPIMPAQEYVHAWLVASRLKCCCTAARVPFDIWTRRTSKVSGSSAVWHGEEERSALTSVAPCRTDIVNPLLWIRLVLASVRLSDALLPFWLCSFQGKFLCCEHWTVNTRIEKFNNRIFNVSKLCEGNLDWKMKLEKQMECYCLCHSLIKMNNNEERYMQKK